MQNSLPMFLLIFLVASLSPFKVSEAQQQKRMSRVGVLSPGSPSVHSARVEVLRQALDKLGYVEGKDIAFELRYGQVSAGGQAMGGQLSRLAAELIGLKPDVVVTSSAPAVAALVQAGGAPPIVFAAIATDPIESGFISSFAKPGGNITGITILAPELDGKRLELLREISPKISRIAVLMASGRRSDTILGRLEPVAKTMGVQLAPVRIKNIDELESALQSLSSSGAKALTVVPEPLFSTHQSRIIALANGSRLPALYSAVEFAEAGGLASYGPNLADNYRRAAVFVDKILRGARAADLPVEQPTKFELVINLKTARQIGLTIPPSILARADRVIR